MSCDAPTPLLSPPLHPLPHPLCALTSAHPASSAQWETYVLEVSGGVDVSLKTTEITIQPGTAAQVIEVALGPAAADVTVVVEEVWREKAAIFEGKLALPTEVPFEIYPTPRSAKPKVQATTSKEGVCELGRGAQL